MTIPYAKEEKVSTQPKKFIKVFYHSQTLEISKKFIDFPYLEIMMLGLMNTGKHI